MIALGTTTILQAIGSHTTMKSLNLKDVQAQYLAEAGTQRALWRCRTTGCVSEAAFPVDGASTVKIDVDNSIGGNITEIKVCRAFDGEVCP